jgi:uncharacterized repeat protein (TIGR03803 family)
MKRTSALLGACLSAALLAACGGSKSLPLGPSSALSSGSDIRASGGRMHTNVEYKTIFEFGRTDGDAPTARLIYVNDLLYGTTSDGGKGGGGTVFKIATDGTGHTVLHNFFRQGDEATGPWAELLNVNGTLYGALRFGNGGFGAIFKVASSGPPEYNQIFGFGGTNGIQPNGLIYGNRKLYGTTLSGDSKGCGGVFQMSVTGEHASTTGFDCTNGAGSRAQLLDDDGLLYGTTRGGGASGKGTVFLYIDRIASHISFDGANGWRPEGSLILVDGKLYGTTTKGGKYGDGTVFRINAFPLKNIEVLHDFNPGAGDGADPRDRLVNVGGVLYGTTYLGGKYEKGTVFKISLDGKDEAILHDFGGPGDGAEPAAGLINVNGTLYGTASGGGKTVAGCPDSGRKGCGTIFSLSGI